MQKANCSCSRIYLGYIWIRFHNYTENNEHFRLLYIFTAHALISAAELIPAAKSCARDKVFHTLIVETTRRRAAVKVTQDVFAYVYRERTDGCHFKSRINSILQMSVLQILMISKSNIDFVKLFIREFVEIFFLKVEKVKN